MQCHDKYGKDVMEQAVASRFCSSGSPVQFNYANLKARIDGTVDSDIAVEIESRVFKQIRGAIMDLICHPYPKKLLILLPVHMTNPSEVCESCSHILSKFFDCINAK